MTSIACEIANSFISDGTEDCFFILDDRNDMIIDGVIEGDPLETHASKENGFVALRGGLRCYETLQNAQDAVQDAVWPDTVGGSHAYISILKAKVPKFCTVWFDDSIPDRVTYIVPALLLPKSKRKKSH